MLDKKIDNPRTDAHQSTGHGGNSHMIMSGLRAGATPVAGRVPANIQPQAHQPPEQRLRGTVVAPSMTGGQTAGGARVMSCGAAQQPAAMCAAETMISLHPRSVGYAYAAPGRSHCATWRSRCPSSERMPRFLLSTLRAICCCILYLRKCTTRCRSSQRRVELVRADYVRPTCNPMA